MGQQKPIIIDGGTLKDLPAGEQLEVNAGLVGTPAITFIGDPNTGIYSSAADAVSITTDGVQRVNVTTTGVTIGAFTLPLTDGSASQVLQTNGSGVVSWATVSGGGMAIGGSITSATQGSVLFAGALGVLAQDNANLFWDDANNRLGIGTATPTVKLHTYESANSTTRLLVENPAAAGTSAAAQMSAAVAGGNILEADVFSPTWSSSAPDIRQPNRKVILTQGGSAGLYFHTSGPNLPHVFSVATGANVDIVANEVARFDQVGLRVQKDGTAAAPSLRFGATADDTTGIWHPAAFTLAVSTNGSERMRIDSSGNVGIGTASPGANRLFVSGGDVRVEESTNSVTSLVVANTAAAGASAAAQTQMTTAGGNALEADVFSPTWSSSAPDIRQPNRKVILTQGGSAGLYFHTSGPNLPHVFSVATGANVDVVANEVARFDEVGLRVQKDGTAAAPSLRFGATADDNTGIWHPAADTLAVSTNGSERMRIASTGNVGIGTAAPATALDVNGVVTANGVTIDSTDGLAVGSTSPSKYAATSPAQITADQNNYNLGTGTFFRLDSDASRNVTGLANGADGRTVYLVNVGANNIVLQNQNAGSSAANRIITGTGADVTLAADNAATLIYDATTQRWRILSVQQ